MTGGVQGEVYLRYDKSTMTEWEIGGLTISDPSTLAEVQALSALVHALTGALVGGARSRAGGGV
jgi:hypothetical protein